MNSFFTRFRMASSALLGLFLLSMAGCSTFHQEWKKAAALPRPEDAMTGRWEGHWISEKNGHRGRLRCVITEKADGQYHAHFHAKYRKILSFGYAVDLQVSQTNGAYTFEGEADLGRWAGGLYHYQGNATPTHFHSTYRCQYDHGTFEMNRP